MSDHDDPASSPYIPGDGPPPVRFCPDCERENPGHGNRPISEFWRKKAARYKGGYRYSAYCKKHDTQRNRAAFKQSEKARATARRHIEAWRKTPKGKLSVKRSQAKYRQTHKQTEADRYARWVAQNQERRRQTQQAYYERKKRQKQLEAEQAAAQARVRPRKRRQPAPPPDPPTDEQ